MNVCVTQGCHLHRTQPGAAEESPAASETEHVREMSQVIWLFKRFVLLNAFPLLSQVLDRTTEEAADHGEDVNHEGQHYQYLCYGKCSFL